MCIENARAQQWWSIQKTITLLKFGHSKDSTETPKNQKISRYRSVSTSNKPSLTYTGWHDAMPVNVFVFGNLLVFAHFTETTAAVRTQFVVVWDDHICLFAVCLFAIYVNERKYERRNSKPLSFFLLRPGVCGEHSLWTITPTAKYTKNIHPTHKIPNIWFAQNKYCNWHWHET